MFDILIIIFEIGVLKYLGLSLCFGGRQTQMMADLSSKTFDL